MALLSWSFSWFILVVTLLDSDSKAEILVACPRRNMYINVKPDGSQKCAPCTPCPRGTQKKRCSLWTNSECEDCPVGSYNKRIGSRCKKCTKCKPGEYILRPCSSVKDTLCSPCPIGTFTSVENAPRCTPCTYCKPHEELVHGCNSTSDYACGKCELEYFRESASGRCLPCSKCFPGSHTVPECYEKGGGYTDRNCMPTDHIRRIFVEEGDKSTVKVIRESKDDSFVFFLLGFTGMILFGTFVIVVTFIYFIKSERTQRIIRRVRDKGRAGTKSGPKLRLENSGYMKEDVLFRLFKKPMHAIKMILRKGSRSNEKGRELDEIMCTENGKEKTGEFRETVVTGCCLRDSCECDCRGITWDTTKTQQLGSVEQEINMECDNDVLDCSIGSCESNANMHTDFSQCNTDTDIANDESVESEPLYQDSDSSESTKPDTSNHEECTKSMEHIPRPKMNPKKKRKRNALMDTTNSIFSNPKYFMMYNTF